MTATETAIAIPLTNFSEKVVIFIQESRRLYKEGKSFAYTFDILFKNQLHIMTCNGIQKKLFIPVSPSFDKNLVTNINMIIATKENVQFIIEDNNFIIKAS